MTSIQTPQNKTLRFKSFDEFVETAKQPSPSANKADGSRGEREEGDAFYGTATFDDAVSLAATGWTEGARRCLDLRASIADRVRDAVVARKAGFGWDLTGVCVDVGKYLTGEPECWVATASDGESTSGAVVHLVANVAASAAVGGDALFVRGAVVFAAIDVLESLGHRVELTVARGTTVNGKTLQIFVPVKSASQPLDADRLAFCLCHPGFLRRLTWSVSEQHGFIAKHTRPAPVVTEGNEILAASEARRGKDFTREQLFEHVADLCQQCGITLPDLVK
jgi:hypothetical protein